MGHYSVTVQATSNSVANTEDEFIELKAAASTSLFLKRVRISCATQGSDVDITARIMSLSGSSAAGSASTPVKKRQLAPAATSAAKVKATTTAMALGAGASTIDQFDLNGRAIFEWIPRGNEEFIESASGGYLAIGIKVSSASIVLDVTVEFEE